MAFFLCVRHLRRLPRECPGMTLRELAQLQDYHDWTQEDIEEDEGE